MALPRPRFIALGSIAVALNLLALAPAAAADQPIGGIAAMSPAARGTMSSGESQELAAGAGVYFQERLATEDEGRLHIELADRSFLDLAANSELVIDKFVYDPGTGAGEIAGNVAMGVLRYIGGAISKNQDAVFTTPSATIAIRGSSMLVEVTPGGETRATFLSGEHMRVTAAGVTREVLQAGFFVSVPRRGAPPSAIRKASRAEIGRALAAVKRRPGEQHAALHRPGGPLAKATPAKGPHKKPPAKRPPAEKPPGQPPQ